MKDYIEVSSRKNLSLLKNTDKTKAGMDQQKAMRLSSTKTFKHQSLKAKWEAKP